MARRALAIAVALLFVAPAGSASAVAPATCGLASPEFSATGDFPASRQGSFVFVPFDVPAGITQVRVNYCYDHSSPGPTSGGNDHTLDLGVYEPRPVGDTGPWGMDEFRGWGGSGYDRVNITPQGFPDDAHYAAGRKAPVEGLTTRSFKPGSIPAGKWAVELGLANIAPAPFDADASVGWRVEVDLSNPPPGGPAYSAPAHDPSPAVGAPGWYAGDFHAHAEHSGDANATLTETMDYGFGTAGLDFISLSDHNTASGWPESDRRRADGDVPAGKLLIRSEEVTTYRGHTNNHASGVEPDYRVGPLLEREGDGSLTQMRAARPVSQVLDEVNAANGIAQVNHPTIFPSPPFAPGFCRGCAWRHSDADTDYSKVDAIEVSTGIPNSPFNPTAIQFWESKLAQGHKIAAVGGSDSHRAGNVSGPTDAPLGTPTTMVFADELSEQGVRRAVEAGHTFVKLIGGSAPDLRLEARRRGAGGAASIFGDTVASDVPVDFTARVIGGDASYQLQMIKNGRLYAARPVTSGSFATLFSSNGPGRYRLQLMQGTQIVAVSTPIYVTGRAGAPGTGSGRVGQDSGSSADRLRAGFGSYGPSRARRGRFLMRCRVRASGRRVCRVRAVANACGRKRTIAFGRAVTRRRSVLVRLRLNRCGRHVLARRRRGVRIRLQLRASDRRGRQAFAVKRAVLRSAGR